MIVLGLTSTVLAQAATTPPPETSNAVVLIVSCLLVGAATFVLTRTVTGTLHSEDLEQEDEWYLLGQVGQTIMAAHPDFDTRTCLTLRRCGKNKPSAI